MLSTFVEMTCNRTNCIRKWTLRLQKFGVDFGDGKILTMRCQEWIKNCRTHIEFSEVKWNLYARRQPVKGTGENKKKTKLHFVHCNAPHIEFIQRNHGLRGFWGANSVLRQRSHVKWIIGKFFVQDGNLAIFMKETFMCNLVGAQVVHRSDGMINSGFFLFFFLIHHGRLLPVMGHNGCPMNRLLCNFVQNHDVWILFPCPLWTVALLLTRTGLSEWVSEWVSGWVSEWEICGWFDVVCKQWSPVPLHLLA